MGQHVVLHYRRELTVPLAEAYAWLTDYQDDDPSRTTAVVKHRPVLERRDNVVVLDGTIEMLGRRGRGRAEVHLFPPDRWEARIVDGAGYGSVYKYHLAPTPGGCRLDVAYHLRARKLRRRLQFLLLRRRALREIDRMWDGFVASMARELAAAPGPAPKPAPA